MVNLFIKSNNIKINSVNFIAIFCLIYENSPSFVVILIKESMVMDILRNVCPGQQRQAKVQPGSVVRCSLDPSLLLSIHR